MILGGYNHIKQDVFKNSSQDRREVLGLLH